MDQGVPEHKETEAQLLEWINGLVERGMSVDTVNGDGETPLFCASEEGYLGIVKMLLERGANVDLAVKEFSETPLQMASLRGHLEVVTLLLDWGANVNKWGTKRKTPLYKAAFWGHLEVVKVLLDRGADINIANSLHSTPLQVASQEGHLEVVRLLIARGATFSAKQSGHTPLHHASGRGHLEVVKELLATGVSVDISTASGDTPLFLAAREGRVEVVRFLLDQGANIHTHRGNFTPLFAACEFGHLDVVKLLIERGVDLQKGFSVLQAAIQRRHLELVKVLVEHDPTLATKSIYGLPAPIVGCCATGSLETIQFLLDHGAREAVDNYRVALRLCMESSLLEVAELLIKTRPQIAVEEPFAIISAARSRASQSSDIVSLLIENGADLNWLDTTAAEQSSQTALHLAVLNRQVDKVWQLGLHGADSSVPYINENTQQTALQLCGGDKATIEALFHFWTPATHKLHPKCVKEALLCVLLVAKRLRWPFDGLLMKKILAHIAFGWWHCPRQ